MLRKGVAQLLCGSSRRGMLGDRHVDDSTTVVREDHEYEEQPEGDGRTTKRSAAMIWLHDSSETCARFVTVDADAAACIWPRSIDSPRFPTSEALRESEGHPSEDSQWRAPGSARARQAVRLGARCGVGFSRSRTSKNRGDATR